MLLSIQKSAGFVAADSEGGSQVLCRCRSRNRQPQTVPLSIQKSTIKSFPAAGSKSSSQVLCRCRSRNRQQWWSRFRFPCILAGHGGTHLRSVLLTNKPRRKKRQGSWVLGARPHSLEDTTLGARLLLVIIKTTLGNGYLSSCIDEEHSKMRYLVWIAESRERNLHPRPLGWGHFCLGVTHRCPHSP